jgi:hypothetical protein
MWVLGRQWSLQENGAVPQNNMCREAEDIPRKRGMTARVHWNR